MDAIYLSSSSFKVQGDRTTEFNPGRRVKLDCGLDGVKYASVVSRSYSSPYTTIVIDESDLTASLTSAWYGVMQAGEIGSLPEHTHDGSEGSGGTISGTGGEEASTFIELTDTPSTYSGTDGQYLQSTGSGTLFAEIQTPPSMFVDLVDTPSTYDYGKYLISTTSGVEWTTISGVSATVSRGKQSMQVEYATTSSVYINPGDIHMADSTYGMYELNSRLEVSFAGLVADTWYYIYTNVSGSIPFLDATNFIASNGVPTIDYPNMGWYSGSNRCIGAFLTDGSADIPPFYTDGNICEYDDDYLDAAGIIPGTTWTDVILTAPNFIKFSLVTFEASTFVANANVYYRKNGSSSTGIDVLRFQTNGRATRNTRKVAVDTSQTIEVKTGVAGANSMNVRTSGHYIPNYIYTGA